jgi:hypothetical protein
MAAAGPAQVAISGVNWDAVAVSESSGNWAVNTGIGFSADFSSHCPRGAPTAVSACRRMPPPETQITVANRVLQTQGIGAWPACGETRPRRQPDTSAAATPAVAVTVFRRWWVSARDVPGWRRDPAVTCLWHSGIASFAELQQNPVRPSNLSDGGPRAVNVWPSVVSRRSNSAIRRF